jgi:hypothetical protein
LANSLVQGHLRPVDFKLTLTPSTRRLEVTLVFENSLVDSMGFQIDAAFRSMAKSASSAFKLNEVKSKSDLFKSTRQVFFSTSRCLMFQVAEFSKSILVQKQPPQFQINVYRVDEADQMSVSAFDKFYSSAHAGALTIPQQSDYFWYFKQMLYLHHSKLTRSVYAEIYAKLKDLKLDSAVDQKRKSRNFKINKRN